MAPNEIPGAALEADVLLSVYRHAVSCYPEECCGFVTSNGVHVPCTNDQARLHAADPERYPRDARRAYAFSFSGLNALNRSLNSDDPAVVIYHSHPDAGAYFSATDRTNALVHGRLRYPADQLVIDVRESGVHESRLYRYDSNDFVLLTTFDTHVARVP